MTNSAQDFNEVPSTWQWDRQRIEQWQVEQFNHQLDVILPQNSFYSHKLQSAGLPWTFRLRSLADLSQFPITSKQELIENTQIGSQGWGRHHTYSPNAYSRLHRTSGTQGSPLMIGDTLQDWQWWSTTWQHVLAAANVSASDRVFLAFSFGPFIGFWSAHQASVDRGAMAIPAGGLTSIARLEFLKQSAATVVCCTPTYAMHLAEVAQAEGFPLADLPVRRLIVAGEPGGSLMEVRNAIERCWQADVIDHAGATEIGPWGFGWPDRCGLHVIESSFIAEILPLPDGANQSHATGLSVPMEVFGSSDSAKLNRSDRIGELVLTSLGRYGAPAIRYRTGDVVRAVQADQKSGKCNFLWLPQGIIGRSDDMLTIRGVNVFPSSIDNLVRGLAPTSEYQVRLDSSRSLQQLSLNIESDAETATRLEKRLATELGLRVDVVSVPIGSLPRSEAKAQRWIRN